MSNVEFTTRHATPPAETVIRTTASTEAGNVGAKIQHVKLDNGDGTTQAIALPSGASTAALQTTGNNTLTSLLNSLADLLTELKLKSDLTETQPVSAASLPLPSGASTSALQTTGNSALSDLLTELQKKADLTETQPVSATDLDIRDLTSASDSVIALPNDATVISGTAAELNADAISVECAKYKTVAIQITGTWSGTLRWEGSNDGTNYTPLLAMSPAGAPSTTTTGTAGAVIYFINIYCRYLRVRMVVYNSGTATVTGFFSEQPQGAALTYNNVWQIVPGTAASNLGKATDAVAGASDVGVAILAKRVDSPSAITPAAGDWAQLQVDANGRLWITSTDLDVRDLTSVSDSVTAYLKDAYGFGVEFTPTDEMRVVEPVRLVGAQFDGTTVDANFWTATVANSATVTQANAQITLAAGTNSAGSAKLNTVRRARYVAGCSNRFRAVVQLSDTGKADNTKKWGVAWGATMPTITDGAYFQLSGTTFSIVTLKGTSATVVNSGSFNGSVASVTLDTNAATYEIYWTNTKVYFVRNGVLLHTVSAAADTWANTVHYHIYLDNINSGNTAATSLYCRVASIYRLGRLRTEPIGYNVTGQTAGTVLKYGPGAIHGIAVSGVANNSAITLYDNTAASGTVVWASGAMGALTTPFDIDLHDRPFSNGLTLVIATANSTVTVTYE